MSITKVVDTTGETRGIDEFFPGVEVYDAKRVEVTLSTEGSEEYRTLLTAAGFELTRIIPVLPPYTILEASYA